MKTLRRLLDRLLPWRSRVRQLEIQALRDELSMTRRERDTAQLQFTETKSVNLHNAAAHRATEVAMLRQNHQLQAAEARLAGKPVPPELAAAANEGTQLTEVQKRFGAGVIPSMHRKLEWYLKNENSP